MRQGLFIRFARFVGRFARRRFTYANVTATLALVVATGGTAMAAVMITSNSQVASNTISGHQAPSGKHSNIIAGSVNPTDFASSVKTSFKVHCPAGLQQAASGLCFDTSPRASATFLSATQTCALAKLRLPTIGELAEAFNSSDAQQTDQWTTSWFVTSNTSYATVLGQNDSRQIFATGIPTSDTTPYRCVTTPTN